MGTYDEAGRTYDEAGRTYDDLDQGVVSLIVGPHGSASQQAQALGDESPLMVHTATHGNSLGTLDAQFDDPDVMPVVEDWVTMHAAGQQLYQGHVRTVTAVERDDGSMSVLIGAQDAGPDPGALPTAAPFNVSDDPDANPGTTEYVSLTRQTRTTEGGTAKTSYQLLIEVDGLMPQQNVEVTSVRHGLAATELEIVEMVATRAFADLPRYMLTLGDPRVRMSQVVEEHEIPDGSITETKISDGAISTPKLQANSVTSEKVTAISGSQVSGGTIPSGVALGLPQTVITADGVEVNDGSVDRVTLGAIGGGDYGLKVVNAGSTVIIDGSSNMFKIAATGTHSVALAVGPNVSGTNEVTLTGLGSLATTPAHLTFLATGNTTTAAQHLGSLQTTFGQKWVAGSSGGSPNQSRQLADHVADAHTALNGSSQVVHRVSGKNDSGVFGVTFYARYYILKEAAL